MQLLTDSQRDAMPVDVIDFVARTVKTKFPSVDFDLCLSAAGVGVMDAWSRFDPKVGTKFVSVATRRAIGQMLDDGRSHYKWMGASTVVKGWHNHKKQNIHVQRVGRSYTPPVSMDALLAKAAHDRPDIEVLTNRQVDPDTTLEDRDSFEKRIKPLVQREWKVLMRLRYLEDMTLKEIGKVIGVCESRVWQMHEMCLKILQRGAA